MPKFCCFEEDHESRTVVYVNPMLVQTIRPNGNKTVIEFADNATVGVIPPVKTVVDQLEIKWNE